MAWLDACCIHDLAVPSQGTMTFVPIAPATPAEAEAVENDVQNQVEENWLVNSPFQSQAKAVENDVQSQAEGNWLVNLDLQNQAEEDRLWTEFHRQKQLWDPFWRPPWVVVPTEEPKPWQFYGNVDLFKVWKWQRSPCRPKITKFGEAVTQEKFKVFEKYFKAEEVKRRLQVEHDKVETFHEHESQPLVEATCECDLDNFLCEGERVLASFTDVEQNFTAAQANSGEHGSKEFVTEQHDETPAKEEPYSRFDKTSKRSAEKAALNPLLSPVKTVKMSPSFVNSSRLGPSMKDDDTQKTPSSSFQDRKMLFLARCQGMNLVRYVS